MKIYCPKCSKSMELPFVPAEGQHIRCPFCNEKFSFSIKMSLSRFVNKANEEEMVSTSTSEVDENQIEGGDPSKTRKMPRNLASCPDCGHLVSKRATTCPNCGAPVGVAIKTVRDLYYEGRLLELRNRSDKNRLVYLLLAFILGWLSVHNFYRGCNLKGVIRIGVLFGGWFAFFMSFVCVCSSRANSMSAVDILSSDSDIVQASSGFDFVSFLGVVFLVVTLSAVIFWIVLLVLDICDDKDGDGKKMYIN